MKKKVLFALIALFSFLTTWAQNQTVNVGGNYVATLGADVKVNNGFPYVLSGGGLPEVTGFTVSGLSFTASYVPALEGTYNYKVVKWDGTKFVDVDNNADEDHALELGNYYLEFLIVTDTQATPVYVPFQVYGDGSEMFDYVYDAESFEDAMEEGHGLYQYYTVNPWSDLATMENVDENIVGQIFQPSAEQKQLSWWNAPWLLPEGCLLK